MKHGLNTDKTDLAPIYKCVVRFEKVFSLSLQLLVGVFVCAGLYYSVEWYWLAIVCLPLEVTSVAVMWWPAIEPANGVVRERALLFDKKLLSERLTPLNEFVEIFYEYTPNDKGDTNYRLGLRHKSGRRFWVDGRWTIRRAVEETAWQISCKTGIKLTEWPA